MDYIETFSLVLKPTTLRILLSLAAYHNWLIRQLDISNAFLQGHLTKIVYMAQPSGFLDPTHPTHVYKLTKDIYDLKQASRASYDELKSYLLSTGFHPTISDPSLFKITIHSESIYVLIYVDDIIVTGSNTSFNQSFINKISHRFSLKDLGPLNYFLGVEVIPTPSSLLLLQSKYTHDILTKSNMISSKPSSTPMQHSDLSLSSSTSPVISNVTEYRALVGSL